MLGLQRAYKRYRSRRNTYNVSRLESARPMVAEAVLKNLHRRVLDGIVSRANIPAEFGSREELAEAGEQLERAFRDRLTRACITEGNGEETSLFRPGTIFLLKTTLAESRVQKLHSSSGSSSLLIHADSLASRVRMCV